MITQRRQRREKVFRDAVHGDMVFDADREIGVIDTPEVQRLRGIKQLGTASLVYPTAVHTRFDHSLGTCWVAQRMLGELVLRGEDISDEEAEIVRLAALVHDVTHIPYGHTFEDERRLWSRHDSPDRTRLFLESGKVGDALEALGRRDQVVELLNDGPGIRPVLRQIVHGTICADLLDYLARDAFFCGLSQRYDDRIFRYFTVSHDQLALLAEKDGIVRQDALSEIINLLRLRYFLSERVYFHHSKVASGAMISKAVEMCMNRGLEQTDLYRLKDEGLMQLLHGTYGKHKEIARLLERIEARRLYKRAFVLTTAVGEDVQRTLIERYHADRAEREKAESTLARRAKVDPADVIVYCPSAGMALKEADVPVRFGPGPPRPLSDLGLPEVAELKKKHRELWKFYVFVCAEKDHAIREVARVAESYFAQPNELRSLQSGQRYLALG